MNEFQIFIPLRKDKNSDRLTGTASATSVDRDDEKMSSEALKMMADDIKREGVNLFGNHEHNWENILGGIDTADVMYDKLEIGINLNTANPKYPQLLGTMQTKGVKLGLSVGGNVTGVRWEYNRELGKKVKVLDKVKIYEVSVVGIPSNADSYLSMAAAISKSAKLPILKQCPICYNKTYQGECELCLSQI